MSPIVFPRTSGAPTKVINYIIGCPHQTTPINQLPPSEYSLISGVCIRVHPHIRYSHQSAHLHQVSPSECPLHQVSPSECPLHQVSPSEWPFTSGVPIRVALYIRHPHQNAPLHQVSPSACPFASGVPITVPPYIRCPHHSATLHQVSPSQCHLTS
ncbi:hypothetical protein AB205_0198480, partial [Aquarana catesbeiana]